MAKVELDPTIKSIRKRMGDLVFRKLPNGETTMIKRADMSNVEWSPAQIENQQRMKQANSYARKALANPKVRAIYQKMAKKQHKHPYHVAVSDYYKGNNRLLKK
jgi:hypothetical protein